jgi:hypothetical protein
LSEPCENSQLQLRILIFGFQFSSTALTYI